MILIFFQVFLSRAKKEECKKLLGSLRDGEKNAIITDFTIHSIIVIMNTFHKLNELETFLLSLQAYKGLHMYHTTVADEIRAIQIAREQNLDMDDAIQYSSAISTNADAIISLDKHFDNQKIPREKP